MDRLSTATKAFIEILCAKKARVLRKEVVSFLTKLLDMAKIFKDECSSEEEKILLELLSNILKQESNLSRTDRVDFLVSLMKVVDLLFNRLLEQVNLFRKLQAERDHFLIEIDNLLAIVDAMRASEYLSRGDTEIADLKEAVKEIIDFQAVRSSANYITHYVSHHHDFSSLVIVVLWKSKLPGPAICHDDMPLLYVHQKCETEESFDAWSDLHLGDSRLPPREYTASELKDAVQVKQVIAEHQKRLFAQHTNLVAIRLSDHVNGTFFIEFVVLCKHFLPIADKESLPRHLEGIPTRVCSGWVELCGRKEQEFHRPLLPGAGFAAGEDAELLLNEENYVPPVLGTLGGYYVSNGVHYGVTCAHCIRKHGHANLHSQGTPVFQPSAMGLVLTAAYIDPELLEAYDSLKLSMGYYGGMKWLTNQLGESLNFTTELPPNSQCGVVHGGVLGPLDNDGPVVDVALVKLAVDVLPHCAPSLKFPGLLSPSLTLGETATDILKPEAFPQNVFSVFGRGSRSIDTMQALVNPFQSDIYFRHVQPDGVGNLVFHCIQADTKKNWQPGDSGTWCWTEDGLLVGMGMAFAHIEGNHYCCIMPMSHVVAAIEQLI